MAPKLDKALLTDGATVVRGLFDPAAIAKLRELYDYCFEHPTPIALSSERGEDRSYTDMLNSDPNVRELTEKALEGQPIGEMLAEVWGSEHVWYLTEEIFLRESKSNKNKTPALRPARPPRRPVSEANGREKVLFGTNFPMIPHAKALAGLEDLGLSDEVAPLFLPGNAKRVFGL